MTRVNQTPVWFLWKLGGCVFRMVVLGFVVHHNEHVDAQQQGRDDCHVVGHKLREKRADNDVD